MKKYVHFIGIGGTGLSAIARVLLERGFQVSGSDRARSLYTDELQASGAVITIGHAAENITTPNYVVRSSAIPDDNPEVLAAKNAGIPVYKRANFLPILIENLTCVAIAGTHGKTTTTAMAAWAFGRAGLDPSYIIGSVSKNFESNAHAGSGSVFVIEADEYDNMFLGLSPQVIILTNLEHDHPDCFPTMADYRQAFEKFIHGMKPGGVVIVCADDKPALELVRETVKNGAVLTYAIHSPADFQAGGLKVNNLGGYSFEVQVIKKGASPVVFGKVDLQVPGEHNVLNALAVLVASQFLSLPAAPVFEALAGFKGTGRRFDLVGGVNGISVINDYAHHPTEIRSTLQAARSRYPDSQIWAVWQPHTYSRTQALLPQFAECFEQADMVLVTDIFASREKPQDYSSETVVKAMTHPCVRFSGSLRSTAEILLDELSEGDVLLVLSAGDADQISQMVLDGLRERSENHG
ncbi:MAG: UDP-N-acetylmuramate--L-alanine ligase [Anaerolineaceae bacterium]